MTAKLIDGKAVAANVEQELVARLARLRVHSIYPKLVAILVGENPASIAYVRNKQKAAERLGILSELIHLPASTSQPELMREVGRCNADSFTHGILVQFPLPSGLDEFAITLAIDPKKDVDGFHPHNVGLLQIGRPAFVSCTPAGVMRMLSETGISLVGKEAVVLGRSNIVGKPMATLLLQRGADATVTVVHSQTVGLKEIVKRAHVVIAAIGRPEFVTGEMVKEGAVVIDVGINRIERGGKGILVGDVHADSVREKASWLSPVPGGVGPMTIAMLMSNTVTAAELLTSAG